MRTGLYTGKTNEELVNLYKSGEAGAFEELMKNTEKLRFSLAQSYLNIPGSELEDLVSEGAIKNFDAEKYATTFSTFLYSAISRRYNTLFKKATSAKRSPNGFVESYDQMNSNSEYEEDGNSLGNSEFSVECEDYSMIEVRSLLESLKLSDRERLVVNLLMDGNSKPDIARRLGVKTPSVHKYVQRIAAKINLSGAYA